MDKKGSTTIQHKKSSSIADLVKIYEPQDDNNLSLSKTLKKDSVSSINNINNDSVGNNDIIKNNISTKEDGDELESDEEQDIQDINSIKGKEKITLKDLIEYKGDSDDLPKDKLKKIIDLKTQTDNIISKTVKVRNKKNIVKALVSKKKNRFCYDGFDLDLTYITSRIIAMGMPSSNLEGLYRNSMEEVQKFLNTRHPLHYKVYNLCEERDYPKNSFYKQGIFPFEDHEAPPLNLMKSFCEDARQFLDEDEQNIVAVHCKAGKGRTGTLICCLLLYMHIFETAKECLLYYGIMRAENGKGVTIPSQIRYVNYFEEILKSNMPHPVIFIKKYITKIRMFTLPKFYGVYTPFFKIENNKHEYTSEKKKTEFKKEDIFALVDFDIEKGFLVEGDVKVTFFKDKLIKKKDKIFKFWFNTNFIPNDCNIYQFKKEEIDKACKDKANKYYSPGFKIEIHFIDA